MSFAFHDVTKERPPTNRDDVSFPFHNVMDGRDSEHDSLTALVDDSSLLPISIPVKITESTKNANAVSHNIKKNLKLEVQKLGSGVLADDNMDSNRLPDQP